MLQIIGVNMFWLPKPLYVSLPYVYVIVAVLVMLGGTGLGKLFGFILFAVSALILYIRHSTKDNRS